MVKSKNTKEVKNTAGDEMLPVTPQDVEAKMLVLREQPVLIDSDVAALYGVQTKEVIKLLKIIQRNSHMVIFLSLISMKKTRWSKILTTLIT